MNIFYLDSDPKTCASYHCDKHVVKMILETAQLLSTSLVMAGGGHPMLYKPTHKNHPCAVWARETRGNYSWLLDLFIELCDEYTSRYGKIHKCSMLRQVFEHHLDFIDAGDFKEPPQCMPDDCKSNDTVTAYRKYYNTHKKDICVWKTGNTPIWWQL